jgi:subtilisin family serine protease
LSAFLAHLTGNGVRVAVVDSGVHAAHSHVNGIAGGVAVRPDGSYGTDVVDRLGHGTAVAAAIREKARDAALIAIKIFWTTLATDLRSLVGGIDAAIGQNADVINLSLGTANVAHREPLAAAAARASAAGAIVVAADEDAGVSWLPGTLDGVIGVRADAACDRHAYDIAIVRGRPVLVTSPYPRDIPGIPRERNLSGISFAVANASGFVARAREASAGGNADAIFHVLAAARGIRA